MRDESASGSAADRAAVNAALVLVRLSITADDLEKVGVDVAALAHALRLGLSDERLLELLSDNFDAHAVNEAVRPANETHYFWTRLAALWRVLI